FPPSPLVTRAAPTPLTTLSLHDRLPISQPGDLILAADGGYRHCQAAGLRPDLLLGDLDSLETPPQALPVQTFPAEKDDTDTMLADRKSIRLNSSHVSISYAVFCL